MIANTGFLAIGLIAGTLHFALLRCNTMLYLRPGSAVQAAIVQLLRLGALAGVLTLAARLGALPLLLAALGSLLARPLVIRWMAPEP